MIFLLFRKLSTCNINMLFFGHIFLPGDLNRIHNLLDAVDDECGTNFTEDELI